jgi:hypothetical protein
MTADSSIAILMAMRYSIKNSVVETRQGLQDGERPSTGRGNLAIQPFIYRYIRRETADNVFTVVRHILLSKRNT